MKKILAILLATALVMSCGISAFAEIKVDGEEQEGTSVEVESAYIVSANASGDELSVQKDVNNAQEYPPTIIARVEAANGAHIDIGGDVLGDGPGILAVGNETTVTVGGDVTDTCIYNDAIRALDGAEVTVGGNVTESGEGNAIYANGDSTVTVNGNVEKGDEGDEGDAINAEDGANITVIGNVTESGVGNAIDADSESLVIVGGNVSTSSDNYVVCAMDTATVIVEGLVDGDLQQYDDAEIYLGQLNGYISASNINNIHYLIGTADESELKLNDVTLESDIVADETIDGVNKEGYRFTTTADSAALTGKTIILTPAGGKKLTVSGFDAGTVNCVEGANGAVTLTLKENFKGGLANLILQLMKLDPQLAAAILADNTIYYDAADYDMQTGNIAVSGADADAVTAYSQADHAGVTFAASLLRADEANEIRVFNGEEELSSEDFSCYFHSDGSMSLIISNTYLLNKGAGAYSFKALVNGVEAAFDLAVVC